MTADRKIKRLKIVIVILLCLLAVSVYGLNSLKNEAKSEQEGKNNNAMLVVECTQLLDRRAEQVNRTLSIVGRCRAIVEHKSRVLDECIAVADEPAIQLDNMTQQYDETNKALGSVTQDAKECAEVMKLSQEFIGDFIAAFDNMYETYNVCTGLVEKLSGQKMQKAPPKPQIPPEIDPREKHG